MTSIEQLQQRAQHIRMHILAMASGPEGAHVGGSLSAADVLAVLYFSVLSLRPEQPDWKERDYFILSKGHASVGLYASLAERGFFPLEELETFARFKSRLAGHPLSKVPGVEFPTGSLGHGLSLGVGQALALRRDNLPNRTFVLLGDGELQEGSVWEAVMAAAQFELSNLTAIVDRNQLQINGLTEQWMKLEPLAERWRSFGWDVIDVDGHDLASLLKTFSLLPLTTRRPCVVIAHTVKGKGVKFLEKSKKSHYVTLTSRLHRKALDEMNKKEV